MSAPNEGGGGGEEKQNHAVTLAEGQLPAPGRDGDLEEDREEKEGVATCGHGDGRDNGTQHEPTGTSASWWRSSVLDFCFIVVEAACMLNRSLLVDGQRQPRQGATCMHACGISASFRGDPP